MGTRRSPEKSATRSATLKRFWAENPDKKGRGGRTKQPTCQRGHPWTAESTIIKPDGKRTCRICRNANARERQERQRWGAEGRPEDWRRQVKSGPSATPAIDRLWPRVEQGPDCCWFVHGAENGLGYGVIHCDGRSVVTHRVMWEALVGPIPDGLELDHLCRNPNCCNPGHLEPVTHAENLRRADWSSRRKS